MKQIEVKLFLEFMDSLGLEYQRTRSHTSFNYPKGDSRRLRQPVIVKTSEKNIPMLHISTNLRTLGPDAKDKLLEFIKSKQKGHKAKPMAQIEEVEDDKILAAVPPPRFSQDPGEYGEAAEP